MTKKKKSALDVSALHDAYQSAREQVSKQSTDATRRAAEALRAILNATLLAALTMDEDEAEAVRELEAMRHEAEPTLKRLLRWRRSHPRDDGHEDAWPVDVTVNGKVTRKHVRVENLVTRKKPEDKSQFLQVLRHSMSAWRLPMPSPTRRHPPTMRDVAAQLAVAIEHGRAVVDEAHVRLPATHEIVDNIMTAWTTHVESQGEYQLGDAGSERMIVDAYRAVGLPRKIAEGLYDFAHRKKRAH